MNKRKFNPTKKPLAMNGFDVSIESGLNAWVIDKKDSTTSYRTISTHKQNLISNALKGCVKPNPSRI